MLCSYHDLGIWECLVSLLYIYLSVNYNSEQQDIYVEKEIQRK